MLSFARNITCYILHVNLNTGIFLHNSALSAQLTIFQQSFCVLFRVQNHNKRGDLACFLPNHLLKTGKTGQGSCPVFLGV